ncbi:MAG: hypothetical protein RML94_01820 [Bacteroidia bacterium]|nr:hypothetical protein [Bacteroidia bacterium]
MTTKKSELSKVIKNTATFEIENTIFYISKNNDTRMYCINMVEIIDSRVVNVEKVYENFSFEVVIDKFIQLMNHKLTKNISLQELLIVVGLKS